MHLKIEANGEEQIFVFKNKSAVTIGRSSDCDISLGYEGVSRVHLQVHERNGEYFVEDLGATNGTFINDQPLRPKELAPFNSFFPIKLGHSVYLYLLDEVSAEQMNEEALAQQELEALKMREEQKKLRQEKLKKERVYVPKSQGKVKVEDLSGTHKIKRKKIAVGTKQRPVRKDKFFLKALVVLGLVIVAGFAAKNVILKKLKGSDTTIAEGVKKVPIKKAPAPVKEFDEQRGDGIVNLDKCFGEKEGILCKALTKKRERSNREGFVQLLTNMYLAVDINSLIEGLGSNYKYTETEIEEVENAMKLRLGRAFSGIEFKDNNFRYQEVDRQSSISQKIALLTDLIANDMAEEVLKISEIKKLYVVLYDSSASNKYLGHVIYNREQLLPLVEEKKLQKDLLFYWRSGLPIRGNELDGFKGIELKSL